MRAIHWFMIFLSLLTLAGITSGSPRPETFNKVAADPYYKPDKIISKLNLKPGDFVLDLGAGGGYFSYRFADLVGNKGKVFALDVNPSYLNYIRKELKKRKLNNVRPVLVEKDSISRQKTRVDLIFLRNVYHHIDNRVSYFKQMRRLLKPHGRLVIIDHLEGDPDDFITKYKHFTPRPIILKEMKAAGYSRVKEWYFLPNQTFIIYRMEK
ncbi:MAG: class I SAM-dependent methyltransferase [Spirochaetota bacterium]|nr:class I SAM-dependent methyltransferase [Spirochaetota bacterium]